MPIKWRQFDLPTPKRNFPFDDEEEERGWVPFMPAVRNDGPAVDIYQDKNNLYVEISLGGVKPEDVEISIEDNVLTVSGKSQEKIESKEKDYFRKEIKTGSFRRVIKLPVSVKENQAMAESFRGLLKITIPKAAKSTARAKNIPIKIK